MKINQTNFAANSPSLTYRSGFTEHGQEMNLAPGAKKLRGTRLESCGLLNEVGSIRFEAQIKKGRPTIPLDDIPGCGDKKNSKIHTKKKKRIKSITPKARLSSPQKTGFGDFIRDSKPDSFLFSGINSHTASDFSAKGELKQILEVDEHTPIFGSANNRVMTQEIKLNPEFKLK